MKSQFLRVMSFKIHFSSLKYLKNFKILILKIMYDKEKAVNSLSQGAAAQNVRILLKQFSLKDWKNWSLVKTIAHDFLLISWSELNMKPPLLFTITHWPWENSPWINARNNPQRGAEEGQEEPDGF